MKSRVLLLLVIWLTSLYCHGELRLAGIFTDNAVLQRELAVPVWGWANPGQQVNVQFDNQLKTTITGADGRWMVRLDPMVASDVERSLWVMSPDDTLMLRNVLVGEVWFASGQSNMEWKLKSGVLNQEKEITSANYPQIRINTIQPLTSAQPIGDLPPSSWQLCSPSQVPEFSAVAYFFARNLHLDKQVPVGVIVAARGATNLETWMSRERLMTHPDFYLSMHEFENDTARWNLKVRTAIAAEKEREVIARTSEQGLKLKVHTLSYRDAHWKRSSFPLNITSMGYPGYWGLVWLRKIFPMNEANSRKNWILHLPIKDQDDRIYLNGKELARSLSKLKEKKLQLPVTSLKKGNNLLAIRMYVHWGSAEIGNDKESAYIVADDGSRIEFNGEWSHSTTIEPPVAQWQNYYNTSTVNYNAMVAPVIPYAIRGFLWYQGENNAGRYNQYAGLQSMLIDDWRVRWQQGYLPFLFVQLANYKQRSATPVEADDWASFRDAQTATLLRSTNTAMACAIDIGDANDIHPKNKQDVGRRLYLAAKAKAYGDSIVYSGPVFTSFSIVDGKIHVHFTNTGSGLVVKNQLVNSSVHPDSAKGIAQDLSVKGFAVKIRDGNWQWTNAYIDTTHVVLELGVAIDQITHIQYAWQSNPEVNLYNAEGLPAVPFKQFIDSNCYPLKQ